MHLDKIRIGASLIACTFLLTACAFYEKNFEHQAETSLDPVNASGVTGSATLGLDRAYANIHMRIDLHGLSNNKVYRVRFFDAPGCGDQDLAHIDRTDDLRTGANEKKNEWRAETEPASLAGNIFGTAKRDFEITPPDGRLPFYNDEKMHPVIVIYAPTDPENRSAPTLRRVACGKMSASPMWMVPHT